MWKKISEKIDWEELKKVSSILVFAAVVAIFIFAFKLGTTAVLLSFPIIAVNLWLTWKGTPKYKGMAFGTVLIGFALYYFFLGGYFDWGISGRAAPAVFEENNRNTIAQYREEGAAEAGDVLGKDFLESLRIGLGKPLREEKLAAVSTFGKQINEAQAVVSEVQGGGWRAGVFPLPSIDSPVWYRLAFLAAGLLIIGLVSSWFYTRMKNAGKEIVSSKLVPVGFVLFLISVCAWLFPMDISKEPGGTVFGREISLFGLPTSGLPLKLAVLGAALMALGMLVAAVPQKKKSLVKGLGLAAAALAVIMFLFPSLSVKATDIYHKGIKIEKIQIPVPVPSFSRSAEAMEKKTSPGLAPVENYNGWVTVMDVELSPTEWTGWFDSTRFHKWKWINVSERKLDVEVKGEESPRINFGGHLDVGSNKIVRFRGNGRVIVKALPW